MLYSDSKDLDPDVEYGNDFVLENSTQLHINRSMHPNASKVDEIEYEKVIHLLQHFNIKSTEYGPRDRSILKDLLYAKKWIGSHEEKMQDTVNKAMKKYIAGKKKLYETYSEIQKMAGTDGFQKEVSALLEKRFPKYMEHLQERITKLEIDDIEICVIGWTCAGKSTFLNILLGEDILPTNVLPNTSRLVRLHNSQTRKIQFVAEDNASKSENLTDDPLDAKSKLESIFVQCCGSGESLDVVDLYWPIPRLHENVVFVDTPGIGHNKVFTEQVKKHVPNAAGYIFIINSGEGGGILEEGIVQLFEAIKAISEGEKENKLGNVLFICNKWDLIDKHETETVWEHTLEKLKLFFGVIEDWQIIPFKASMEFQLMQLRASPTDDFVKLLGGLERLMSTTIKNHFLDFSGWINKVMQNLANKISLKMNLISLSSAELAECKKEMEKKLKAAEVTLKRTLDKIETLVCTKKAEIIKDLQKYLKSQRVQQRLCDWRNNVPDAKDMKAKVPGLIMERIHQLISVWAEKEEGLLKKGTADIQKECSELADKIQAHFRSIDEMIKIPCPEFTVDIRHTFVVSMAKVSAVSIAQIGAVSIGFAVSVAVSAIGLFFLFPIIVAANVLIFERILDSQKESEMTKLALEAINKVSSKETTEDLINTLFERPFKTWIDNFRSDKQLEIASMQETIEKETKDLQSLTILESLLHELNMCLMHLEKIGVEYYSDDSVSCECLYIESSSVSTTDMFHLHDVANLHQGKRFTLRVIHTNYSNFHIQEIRKLRTMKHINFMTPECVVYSTSIPEEKKACGCSADSLRVLTQRSTGDLESYVFSNQRVPGCYFGKLADGFFKKMTLGIANGLSYVHEMGFVHGHLQLSSIMLADDMTPKLCDINILSPLQERNRKICIFHTAPEVINGEKYGQKADIYSLGILLWELWYGRHTPPGTTLTENSVCDGERPKFEEKYPKQAWIDLMQSCWTDSPEGRPSAAECVHLYVDLV